MHQDSIHATHAHRVANEQREVEDAAGLAQAEARIAESVLHSAQAANQATSARLSVLRTVRQQAEDASVQARQDVLALEHRVAVYEQAHAQGAALADFCS